MKTSLQIANEFGINHKVVIDDIQNYLYLGLIDNAAWRSGAYELSDTAAMLLTAEYTIDVHNQR